ncbi:MAG: hypothetical protein IKV26_02520 [Paludibacteraceae bacterium]|nr:hypothetical protein [Paludibacteraceae bacterium]
MGLYQKYWSSSSPGLIIICGNSNLDSLCSENVANLINRVINEILMINFDGDAPKNRCFISVIGYNHNMKELCSGWLKDLDENPLRYETLKKKTPDGTGGIYEIEVKQPVWVEPTTQDGATNMLGVLSLAKDLASQWISDNPDGPAPVIINISDGVPYYNGKDPRLCMQETLALAKEIMNISNTDGNVLFFNVCLKTIDLLQKDDIAESFLCEFSSKILKETNINVEIEEKINLSDGFIYNDNINKIEKFLFTILYAIFAH